MSDFSTEADVHLAVPQSELRNVRQQIESAVGTTEIGMTDGGTMSAQAAGGGGGGRARRRARREHRWARERTSYLEEAVVYLEGIDDKVGEGGGGGGGVLDDVVGAVVETGGDAAIEGAGTLTETALDALSTAVGNSVANAINNNSVDVEDVDALEVEEPGWTPIAVEDAPGPVGFEELPGPVGFEPLPGPVQIEEPPGPYPLQEPTEPYPVEEIDPIEIDVTVSTPGSGGGGGSGGGEGGGGFGLSDPFDRESNRDGLRKIPFIGDGLAETDRQITNWNREQWGLEPDPPDDSGGGGSSGQSTTVSASSQEPIEVEVTNNASTEIVVEPPVDSLTNEVLDALEREYQGQIDEIESDLQDLQREFDRIDRRVRQG